MRKHIGLYRTGFTLLELVVAVAVIAALVAIALPRLGGAREQTKNVVLQNFLKDCRTVYQRLSIGVPLVEQTTDTVDYIPITEEKRLDEFLSVGLLKHNDVRVQYVKPNQLVIRNLPTTFFKNGATTLTVTFGSPVVYNGLAEAAFLQQALW